jgi:hypothetical protein
MGYALYKITEDFLQIENLLNENGGELTTEIKDMLEIHENNLQLKVEEYVGIIKSLIGEQDTIKNEIQRLNSLHEEKERIIQRLKTVLLEALQTFGTPSPLSKKQKEEGKVAGKQLRFPTVFLYTSKTDSVIVDVETFNDTRFIEYQIKTKLNQDVLNKVNEILMQEGLNVTTEKSINKSKLKTILKEGETFTNAYLETKPHIIIK